MSYSENEIAKIVMDICFDMHRKTGPGLFESVYEVILYQKLLKVGLSVGRQVPIDINFEGIEVPEAFRADLIVEGKVIVELKSLEKIAPVHKKQVLTYLRLANCRLGLLVNFGAEFMKDGFKRVANDMMDGGEF